MALPFSDEQLLDRIFGTSPTGIVVLTPDGQITRCNQRAEQLLRLEEGDIESKTYRDPEWTFVDEDGEPIPEADHPFTAVRDTRGPIFNREYRMDRPHADTLECSISGAPIVAEDGTIERIVFAFEDIGERLERERELRLRNDQLEVLNRVVRHDIRNDMGVVLGWLDILDDEIESQQGRDAFERIREASQHVVELTETTRDLVDVLTGEGSIEAEPVALGPLLRTAVDVAQGQYPDAEIRVAGALPAVEVQASDLLGSVFQNLLNNAVQHNDADVPEITVALECTDATVRVSVADNGPGVPEAEKWEIFGKGEKGLESGGTGIGLYLVESVVSQVGGDVWVEDNAPRGAVFVVELDRPTAE